MKESFEQFLMGKCEEDTHALDDDLPDTYNDWIGEQDVQDIIDWAEEWALEALKKENARGFHEAIVHVRKLIVGRDLEALKNL